ncbi:hypothetical protein C3F09_06065 [candidate division GN15 bacterium]|uniref:Uncharacterized protein n=1 Tax=candidate division GN15 bacterium TaxID=2072418 RepID=A0A855X190_9BACT|nr:MAG: hypothetical protein C3F09_06065 [candidate division GN15 bacterium]
MNKSNKANIKRYREQYQKVKSVIARHDPIGLLNQGAPEDEYELEISLILPMLCKSLSVTQLSAQLSSLFRDHYGDKTAGRKAMYEAIAADLMKLSGKDA